MDIIKANVLINEAKHACLADFGLLTIISDTTSPISSTSFTQGGTCRWMSPELFDPENDGRPTKHSDGYALGMLIYEVLSGQVPFSQHRNCAVIAGILRGERPGRPDKADKMGFTDDVWGILGRCWESIPSDRPEIEDVLRCLENASLSWMPPPPQTTPSLSATGSPAWESMNESPISLLSQEISSRQSRKHPEGDSDWK